MDKFATYCRYQFIIFNWSWNWLNNKQIRLEIRIKYIHISYSLLSLCQKLRDNTPDDGGLHQNVALQ